jgi:hypothetical protein
MGVKRHMTIKSLDLKLADDADMRKVRIILADVAGIHEKRS